MRNPRFKRSGRKIKQPGTKRFEQRFPDIVRRKKKGETHTQPIYHARSSRQSPRGASSGKPSLSKSIRASGRVFLFFFLFFSFLFFLFPISFSLSVDAISLPRPAAEPTETTTTGLSTPRLPPRGLDSPRSYSRPAESGSRLIIRRVRARFQRAPLLSGTRNQAERASDQEEEAGTGEKRGWTSARGVGSKRDGGSKVRCRQATRGYRNRARVGCPPSPSPPSLPPPVMWLLTRFTSSRTTCRVVVQLIPDPTDPLPPLSTSGKISPGNERRWLQAENEKERERERTYG